MSLQEFNDTMDLLAIVNNKFDVRECTKTERANLAKGEPLPENVYKVIDVKKCERYTIFLCWFSNDEVLMYIVNNRRCDMIDVTDGYAAIA